MSRELLNQTGTIVALGLAIVGAIVWAVRLEGKINEIDVQFERKGDNVADGIEDLNADFQRLDQQQREDMQNVKDLIKELHMRGGNIE